MRVLIAAVGRLKERAEKELLDRYLERLAAARSIGLGPVRVSEVMEGRQPTASARRQHEAERLLHACAGVDVRVVLDGNGQAMSSEAFARMLARRRDEGASALAFLIGGPDGHGKAALDAATVTLSLGPMTLPHGLARVVLVEQLYRATTILTGHPYHRG
jgi:23S rRNA (pseudouridine1915-N3)-methyltransferase